MASVAMGLSLRIGDFDQGSSGTLVKIKRREELPPGTLAAVRGVLTREGVISIQNGDGPE
jgi:hypothetical protein